MITIVLIAVAAGCASALMFASIISGALISLLLFCLAPLPLMMAALGWGPLSAAIGGIVAAIGLGAVFGFPYCIAFVVAVALPAWWLGHLALLGRPMPGGIGSANGASPAVPELEWYPVGRILLWIAGFATLITMADLFTLGADADAITSTLRRGVLSMIGPDDAASTAAIQPLINGLVTLAPAAAAIGAMLALTFNLWLAAKITATSGRLHRPWPDLKSAALPPMMLVSLVAAIGFCFIGGLPAILALIVAAVLVIAYALTGFAVLHTLTLAFKSRALWLSCAYTVVIVFSWPVLAIAALGAADTIFGFRQRYLQSRPPPIPAS
jgi:hypothetical protein